MAVIFDFPVTGMSKRVHISPAVLLDPEHVSVAFRIVSLSIIEAEILRYFICTSGNGGHLYPVTRLLESVYISPTVLLDPQNMGVAFRISLLSCIEAEI